MNVSNKVIGQILGHCRMPSFSKPEGSENSLPDLVIRSVQDPGPHALREICDVLAASYYSALDEYAGTAMPGPQFTVCGEDGYPLDPAGTYDARTRHRLSAHRFLDAWDSGAADTMDQITGGHLGQTVMLTLELCNILYALNTAAEQPHLIVIRAPELLDAVTGEGQYTQPHLNPATLISLLLVKHGPTGAREIADILAEGICSRLGAAQMKAVHGKVRMQLFDINAIALDPRQPCDPGLSGLQRAQDYLTAWLQDEHPAMCQMTAGTGPDAMMLLSGLCLILQGLHLGQKAEQ